VLPAAERLAEIPGVSLKLARAIIAESGSPGALPRRGPLKVKWTAGEVPLAGSFSVGLFPNRACGFPRTLLSSDHFG
jgi:hypothetical protein